MTHQTFDELGIDAPILKILHELKFTVPTPIQSKSIPPGLQGNDIIGIAQTGTGKTLAFGIPMIDAMLKDKGHGLIVLPTRELALQVDETLRKVGGPLGIKTAVLIGGASMHLQKQMIRNRPDIVVATPGRLIDHLEQRTISLGQVAVLVLDEADRMLDMGFAPQINRILEVVPKERQTLLFSATMPSDILRIARNHMKTPVQVEIAPVGTTAEKVEQELFIVQKNDKIRLLEKILGEEKGSVLVFSRTKHGAKKIMRSVANMGHTSAEIHANRSLAQRREALDGFKKGKYRVLVATDIASRGIDVTGIALVVNFDIPEKPDDYVHRIGRTARAGLEGKAITFASPDQQGSIRDIERLIRLQLPRKQHGDLPAARAQPIVERDRDQRRPTSAPPRSSSPHNPRGRAAPRNRTFRRR